MPGTITLQGYITQVRRLLKDPNANYWSDADLTAYINEAIGQVIPDTGCLRKYQSITLVAGQDTYNFSAFSTQPVIDLVGCYLIYGNDRIPLQYKAFTELNSYIRSIVNWQQYPCAWTVYAPVQTFILGPIPDQGYTLECDTVYLPADLANYTDVCPVLPPFTAAIKYYAAYLAQLQFQSMEKATLFKELYKEQCFAGLGQSYTARIPNVYQNG